MLANFALALSIALGLLALYVATRPGTFSVTRSALIAAPPAAVFPHVDTLRNWEAWSPWAKLDPSAKSSYSGPASGRDASFAWDGNRNVGSGRMTIVDSRPGESVVFRLDFEKPMKGTNEAVFTFVPESNGTRVTWTMSGRNNFMAKAVNVVIDCNKMVGGMFDQGLADLAVIAERKPAG